MKKVTKKGTKPTLKFVCKCCESEWETDEWRVKERKIGGMFGIGTDMTVVSKNSECPVCMIPTEYRGE